jgi:hypothetical protein
MLTSSELRVMARDSRHIMQLMMPRFSGSIDKYGKEIVPPVPLSFDRVMEGRPPSTPAPLFRVPDEILSIIVQYVDHESLRLLALVNSDCRQWARAVQFNSICLDYSPSSLGVLHVLLKEVEERISDTKTRMTFRPALGACIRRITVATEPSLFGRFHEVDMDDDFRNLDVPIQAERLRNAAVGYFDLYLASLNAMFIDSRTLPYIELLDWEDSSSPPQTLFDHLAQSSVQHLKLYRIPLDEEYAPSLVASPCLMYCKLWYIQNHLLPTVLGAIDLRSSILSFNSLWKTLDSKSSSFHYLQR